MADRIRTLSHHLVNVPLQRDTETPLLLRPVQPSDDRKGLFALLSQLTVTSPLSRSEFVERLEVMWPNTTVLVVEDEARARVVATASLHIVPKLTRGGKDAARIEDVVVDQAYRGRQIGRRLVDALLKQARSRGCYKVALTCAHDKVGFYGQLGFRERDKDMALYF